MVRPSNKPWSLGEMAGLRYSIHLLKKRFGTRQFPYPMHVHKALSKPLLIESKMMWKEEFEKASAERFRGGGLMANSHMVSFLSSCIGCRFGLTSESVLATEWIDCGKTSRSSSVEFFDVKDRHEWRRRIRCC